MSREARYEEEAAISDERLGQLMGKGAEHAYKVVLINGTKSADLDLEVSLCQWKVKAE